jgi:hypothetical protein
MFEAVLPLILFAGATAGIAFLLGLHDSCDGLPYCKACDNNPLIDPADRTGYCRRCKPPLDLYPGRKKT